LITRTPRITQRTALISGATSTYYGYKNHINVDNNTKLIRRYTVTDASVHDSKMFAVLIDPHNTNADVYADSAYRSASFEAELKEAGYRNCRSIQPLLS
jgi:IS5 family transposase